MSREKSEVRLTEFRYRGVSRGHVVHAAFVFVHQDKAPSTQGRALVKRGRGDAEIGHDRPEEGVIVHCPTDTGSCFVER
jgi:hypothetical protein